MSDQGGAGRGDAEPDRAARIIDPRAVRVGTRAPLADRAPVTMEAASGEDGGVAIVDGRPLRVRLDYLDPARAIFREGGGADQTSTRILFMPPRGTPGHSSAIVRREVVVDGWRVEVEIESERHAALRARAGRVRETTVGGGPTTVRAIIPGRIVSVSIVPGDRVAAGQQLLVVEAMKMQNDLRAPRDGIVSSVAVAVGSTIEVGDLMLVLE